MQAVTDQMGYRISLSETPRRIVSLVPSQSELLWELGLRDEIVGITKFCIHPEELFRNKTRIGGTKQLHLEKIRALKPDLIIGNKEENERVQVEQLREEFNVWMSDIFTLEDSLRMVTELGTICGKAERSAEITTAIRASMERIRNFFPPRRVAYFIWNKPYMVAAQNTFIDHVLSHLGLTNAFSGQSRYPEITNEDLLRVQPEICFLSSEPYPFKEVHAEELKRLLPQSEIRIVDGEVFSWYGTRLLHLENYLKKELALVL